ncbi:MAG TPA: sigma-E factor regulatory protein RseB domain-containing protein [Streptosporangiaceae bacterium]|nr:sigma-E factor regulatory protein RseB domain-containing protein [Streptosporangiaceae bacterium]
MVPLSCPPPGRTDGARDAAGRPARRARACSARARRARRDARLAAVALAIAAPGLIVTACTGTDGAGAAPRPPGAAAVRAPAQAAAAKAQAAAAKARSAPAQAAARSAPAKAAGAAPAAAPRPASSARAMRLLTEAAQAAVVLSYQGEEIVSHWGAGAPTAVVTDIWHVGGGPTVAQTLVAGSYASSGPYLSADTDGQAPEGVLGVTAPLVRLLEAHYVVVYAGTGAADDRPTQLVEARRDDGSLAAKFWLDEATKLPLQRQVFDSAARVISEDAFIDVRFGSAADQAMPRAGQQGPWTDPPLPAARLLALRSRGWVVLPALPDGLSLFTGDEASTRTGTVLDLGYSDGLSVVSLFEQHGNLAAKLAGWQKTTVDGHVVYAAQPDQRSLTWSSRGIVYTVMADAPAQTVDAVVDALPHDKAPGFWKRISRGLARLVSLVNPFH